MNMPPQPETRRFRWALLLRGLAWACIGTYAGGQIGAIVADLLGKLVSAAGEGSTLRIVGMVVGGLAGLVAGVWNARKNVGAGKWEISLALVGAVAGFIGGMFMARFTPMSQRLPGLIADVLNGTTGAAIAGSIVAAWQRFEPDEE